MAMLDGVEILSHRKDYEEWRLANPEEWEAQQEAQRRVDALDAVPFLLRPLSGYTNRNVSKLFDDYGRGLRFTGAVIGLCAQNPNSTCWVAFDYSKMRQSPPSFSE